MKKTLFLLLSVVIFLGCTNNMGDSFSEEDAKTDIIRVQKRDFFSAGLKKWMEKASDTDMIDVYLAVKDNSWESNTDSTENHGSASVDDGEITELTVNKSRVSVDAFSKQQKEMEARRAKNEVLRTANKMKTLESLRSRLEESRSVSGDIFTNVTLTTVKMTVTNNRVLRKNCGRIILKIQGCDGYSGIFDLKYGNPSLISGWIPQVVSKSQPSKVDRSCIS